MKGVNKFNLGLAVMLALLLAANCQGSAQRSFAKQQVKENRISANNSVLLLLDHQTGLFQLVKDYDVYSFKKNVLALAATAKLYGMPTILTTSLEQGPNGPLLPELRAMLPNTTFIPRPGEINAWDNTDFVNAVKV